MTKCKIKSHAVIILLVIHFVCVACYKSPKNYIQSFDWKAKENGENCRNICDRRTAYAGSFCAATASFLTSAGCNILDINEPLICGLVEGPSNGLDNFCGGEILEQVCDECDQPYNIKDVLAFALNLESKTSKRILTPIMNVTKSLQNFVQNTFISLEKVSFELDGKLSANLVLAKYEKTLMQLRFLSQLFSRINLDLDNDVLEVIKTNYIRVAIDTPYQDGIISLVQTLHSLLTGRRLTIYGPSHPSILALKPELCKDLLQLEELILSLHFQAQFVYKDHQDLQALTYWLKDIRTEEIATFKSLCG